MTASDHLSTFQFPDYQPAIGHGEQLPMFMTPKEIGGMMSADFGGHMRDVPERMRSSYQHSADTEALRGHTVGRSKLDRISDEVKAEGGVHTPVKVSHLESGVAMFSDGHHRAVSAMEQNKLLPVEHYFDHKSVMHAIRRDNGEL